MLSLGGFVEGSGGAMDGSGTERFSCLSANSQTDVVLDNFCSKTLGELIGTPKIVIFLGGDALNVVAVYGG